MVYNVVGSPVEGNDFYDRKREVAALWRRLETDHILLLAPRRVGKSSVIRHLHATAATRGMTAVEMTTGDLQSELAFVSRLTALVQEAGVDGPAVGSGFTEVVKRINSVEVMGVGIALSERGTPHWAECGGALIRSLSRSGKWLLLIDELPIFVNHLLEIDTTAARARAFLGWFRALRQDRSVRQVRFLIAGSIGLDTVTRRVNLGDTINDLYIETGLDAFSVPVSLDFLAALANAHGVPLSPATKARVLERTGWLIPYYLQLCFAELRTIWEDERREITPAVVDEAYGRMLANARSSNFDCWEQRLYRELGRVEAGYAVALLDTIAYGTGGATAETLRAVLAAHIHDDARRDEQFRELIDILQRDGYLVRDGRRFAFRSPLVRDYWRSRFVGREA
jgi:AAA+ ATPase superfamily predicted ATPase